MAIRSLFFVAVISLITTFSLPARAGELYGMLQMSRNDGLVAFYLIGTFRERTSCKKQIESIIDPFVASAKTSGYDAQIDFATCDDKIPAGTSYEALGSGQDAKHYVLFTPNMRIMMIHERGSEEYERQTCEHIRGQLLQAQGIVAECRKPQQ